MAIEINKIKEIYEGTYFLSSDSLAKDILHKILDKSVKYVWGINHKEYGVTWKSVPCQIYEQDFSNVFVRNVNMEFLMKTEDFCKILPRLKHTNFHLIQTNRIPPYYLDINRIKGKTLYELLKNYLSFLCCSVA